ncbi:MAG: hypothetical protein KKG84_00845 [Candidatus Omnitrophica bacterium]|nr:hypothetical protein [Candidatus Omnitrophota bacterium]
MIKRWIHTIPAFMTVILALHMPCRPVQAQDVDMSRSSYDAEKGERTINGLKFFIAEDRRIVSNGQYIEPESLDKYLGRKFDAMSAVLDEFSDVLSQVEDRLSELESSMDKLTRQVRASMVQPGEASQKIETEVRS